MFEINPILATDSYKHSHFLQDPPGLTRKHYYIESRGGIYPEIKFAGLQMFIKNFLQKQITLTDVDEAEAIVTGHGEPFNRKGWRKIVIDHNGYLPVRIRAVPEGSVWPVLTPLVTVETTDPELPWVAGFVETALLRAVWYPSTVATTSWRIKKLLKTYLEETGDVAGLPFKLHDFGARGVSSQESAAIGGLAHLFNFMGSDTMEALVAAKRFYGEPMAAFSIPAAEHSTVTAWGKPNEVEAFANMVKQFSKPGSIYAVVSDSYDIFNAAEKLWGEQLKAEVIAGQGLLVVRPDSGDPVAVCREVVEILGEKFGYTTNAKGFKVLNHVRVIQGDGVNETSINAILLTLRAGGWSADNIAFGMGGALLQGINRDTCKWAMKCSAVEVNGNWVEVFKQPVTDKVKVSKKGRQDHAGLRTVYEDGKLLIDETLETIRGR